MRRDMDIRLDEMASMQIHKQLLLSYYVDTSERKVPKW